MAFHPTALRLNRGIECHVLLSTRYCRFTLVLGVGRAMRVFYGSSPKGYVHRAKSAYILLCCVIFSCKFSLLRAGFWCWCWSQ